jgi:hypothetical protein
MALFADKTAHLIAGLAAYTALAIAILQVRGQAGLCALQLGNVLTVSQTSNTPVWLRRSYST